jgi:hypothetical protein
MLLFRCREEICQWVGGDPEELFDAEGIDSMLHCPRCGGFAELVDDEEHPRRDVSL